MRILDYVTINVIPKPLCYNILTDETQKTTEQTRYLIFTHFFAIMVLQQRKDGIIMEEIKAVGLVKRYRNICAVDGLDIEIRKGELFSLLGVNGAGKTTVIKMLSCLTRPTGGEAFVGGYSIVREGEKVKGLIGTSPQETAVAQNLSVKENLELICKIHGFSREKTKQRVEELSESLSLDSVLSRKAGKLSGGWQRRVSIAMALVSEPRILFLDEPTLGIDVLARQELWDVIRSLKGKITVVLTTHYMEEAEALSDRIAIMKSGRVLALGTAEELKNATGCTRFEDAFVSIVKEAKV